MRGRCLCTTATVIDSSRLSMSSYWNGDPPYKLLWLRVPDYLNDGRLRDVRPTNNFNLRAYVILTSRSYLSTRNLVRGIRRKAVQGFNCHLIARIDMKRFLHTATALLNVDSHPHHHRTIQAEHDYVRFI